MGTGYRALAAEHVNEYEEKRSQFITVLVPVCSREQAMDALVRIKAERPGANHYCWAYIVGAADQPKTAAFSDDGEPSGTAGKPMLHVLQHRDAGDCLAVVVRFFGGVKLGAGGLVRAYSASVSGALDGAAWRSVVPKQAVIIEVPFPLEQKMRHLLGEYSVQDIEAEYRESVSLCFELAQGQVSSLRRQVAQLSSGAARVLPEEKKE
ncbi:IMPACT family protein [Gilvimarinus xylanilyticus]|uniref:IMPACT family protein n=1 Tax=Gilvimarinus xylanilyticus TaxID=2944139 RepID=A0A9X2I2U4_9GAMM|nr:YigZ family protein [Gilvimarinus xylanilyticus]MCP8899798.1 IMPACT family protein [Gilvimarinus xylanilyticus]